MAIVSQDTPNSPVPSVLPDIPEAALADPPPPYPTPGRRQRQPRSHRARVHAAQLVTQHSLQSSTESQSDYEAPLSPYAPSVVFTDDEDAISMSRGGGIAGRTAGPTSENTLFLTPANSRRQGRPRSFSMSSTTSAAESLAHTVMSLFQTEDDVCYGDGNIRLETDEDTSILSSRRPSGLFSGDTWRRYFRPMGRKAFYRPLVHLAFINFPYALAAWVYLFIFTVSGTTLLVALPIGAVLCFFNLLGARAFARGELSIQSRFHAPLVHPPPYPHLPIFTRYREPTIEELENGTSLRGSLIREKSFYKNTYAMFTDSRSYQALFYFLVIKPAITLLISIGMVAFGMPLFILVLPAPAILRAMRKIGIWQANVAVEGLYYAVR